MQKLELAETMTPLFLRIQDKLERIRNRWFARRSFGQERHRFVLQPPIPNVEVVQFENERGIRLPAEYRDFLIGLANGGAGPGYGLLSLNQWSEAADCDGDPPRDFLARPSLLRPDLPREGWLEAISCSTDALYEERFRGLIALCHNGCSYYSALVVSGPYRGRIVNISHDDLTPDFARDANFLSWYERWLDEFSKPSSLGEVAWFGHRGD